LDYRRCVRSIQNQSDNGRASFYAILLTHATEKDKQVLSDLLKKKTCSRA
jgi:hypothetical protein